MPVYEYQCPKGHKFERIVQFSKEEPLETVPCNVGKCKSKFVIAELLASRTGAPILIRGRGGFYKPTRLAPREE